MTLSELIAQVKSEKPNSFSNDKLTEFVNQVESDVAEFLGGGTKDSWVPYDYTDDNDKDLLVSRPYDVLYKYYVNARIDFALEEYESYANNIEQFNACWIDYTNSAIRGGVVEKQLPTRIKNVF